MSHFKFLKKFFLLILGCVWLNVAIAQEEGSGTAGIIYYLNLIAQYTYNTLKAVNDVPFYLETMSTASLDLIAPDNSQSTAELQSQLTDFTATLQQRNKNRDALQMDLTKNILLKDALASAYTNTYANELTYLSLLGQPVVPPDPKKNIDFAKNYVSNLAGIRAEHVIPKVTWRGEGVRAYENYYKTVMAIESYNQYILSDLYVDYQSGNKLSELQNSLIEKASSKTWFTEVSSAYIGIVLRQILMYESQMYILLNELLKTQKQLVYTQAMNNSLLILNNTTNEDVLVRKATGTM